MRARLALRCVLVGAIPLGVLALAASPVRAADGPPLVTQSPNPSPVQNSLTAISAASSTDVWAVGSYYDPAAVVYETLIVHWDGTAWLQVPSPSPSSTENRLTGVREVGPTNVWATGFDTNDVTGRRETLVVHWNGTVWARVGSPNPGAMENALMGIGGGGPAGGVWAAGWDRDATGKRATLIIHWTGSRWMQVASPSPDPADNRLYGVRVWSSTSAYAVGRAGTASLVLRWNGIRWLRISSPSPGASLNVLNGAGGVSSTDAWAVGQSRDGSLASPLALHWSGQAWVRVTTPDPGGGGGTLAGITSFSVSNAWAVGSSTLSGDSSTEVLHWNGEAWTAVPTPNPGPRVNMLLGVAASAPGSIWAVGWYFDPAAGASKTLVLHWDGTAWTQQ